LNHSLFLSTYYFFYYMLYNSKWFKKFQACTSQLALKNDSKKAPTTWTFFHANSCDLVKCIALFFAGPKKAFLSIQMLISYNPYSEFLKFFLYLLKPYYYKILKLNVSKNVCFLKFGTYISSGTFRVFWMKT